MGTFFAHPLNNSTSVVFTSVSGNCSLTGIMQDTKAELYGVANLESTLFMHLQNHCYEQEGQK